MILKRRVKKRTKIMNGKEDTKELSIIEIIKHKDKNYTTLNKDTFREILHAIYLYDYVIFTKNDREYTNSISNIIAHDIENTPVILENNEPTALIMTSKLLVNNVKGFYIDFEIILCDTDDFNMDEEYINCLKIVFLLALALLGPNKNVMSDMLVEYHNIIDYIYDKYSFLPYTMIGDAASFVVEKYIMKD